MKACINDDDSPCPPRHTVIVKHRVIGEVVAECYVVVSGKVSFLDTNNEVGGEKGAEGRDDVSVAGGFGGTGVSGVNGKGVNVK